MEKQILIRPLGLYNPEDSRAIVFDEAGINLGTFEWSKALEVAETLSKARNIPFDIETE